VEAKMRDYYMTLPSLKIGKVNWQAIGGLAIGLLITGIWVQLLADFAEWVGEAYIYFF
jgi:hypothetical protein